MRGINRGTDTKRTRSHPADRQAGRLSDRFRNTGHVPYVVGLGVGFSSLKIPSTDSRNRSKIPALSVPRISTGTKCFSLKPVARMSFLNSFS